MIANAIFPAAERKNYRLLRRTVSQFGVVVAANLCSIAAADEIELFDLTTFDSVDDFVSESQNDRMMKSDG